MARRVDLNADMGEGCGDDAALLRVVTSANICAALHAGSPALMAATMAAARDAGVGIGVHPGFDDRDNFGRTRRNLPRDELRALIAYQVGAAQAVAEMLGTRLDHLKLHGALSNMASEDAELARTCYAAALSACPGLKLVVLSATAQEAAARDLGADWAGEIFADRAYEPDGTLVDRRKPGAVLHDAGIAATRILAMLEAGAIIAEDGTWIPAQIDTICLHGDTVEALDMARELRTRLEAAGVTLARM